MKIVAKSPDPARFGRSAEHPSFQHFSFTQTPLFLRNPLFPALRSSHELSQRHSSQKQIPSNHAALRAQLHRLRKSWRQAVRDAVSKTVSHPDEIDDELGHLAAVLSRQLPE